jgi:Na+-transporting methylmalonyl-CoA/oxaloacetate decarboxylase gamma subunit
MLTSMPLGDAGITALLGYAVVFFGLILLMIVVTIIGKFFTAGKKTAEEVPAAAPAPQPVAPGSAGGVKLYNVDDKTAAMLMAIVADKLQKPLNELRFISIKEVEQ